MDTLQTQNLTCGASKIKWFNRMMPMIMNVDGDDNSEDGEEDVYCDRLRISK